MPTSQHCCRQEVTRRSGVSPVRFPLFSVVVRRIASRPVQEQCIYQLDTLVSSVEYNHVQKRQTKASRYHVDLFRF